MVKKSSFSAKVILFHSHNSVRGAKNKKMPFTQSQTQDIIAIVKTTIAEMLSEDMISRLVEKVLQKVNITDIQKNASDQEKRLTELSNQNNLLVNKIQKLEQFTRNKNIRIYGLKEEMRENTENIVLNLFANKLNLKDYLSDNIDHTYRIGKPGDNKTRAIMVRFTNLKAKNSVIKNRKLLRGSGVIIADDMVKEKHVLLKEAAEILGKNKVWCRDGIIFANVNNQKTIINNKEDLDKMLK